MTMSSRPRRLFVASGAVITLAVAAVVGTASAETAQASTISAKYVISVPTCQTATKADEASCFAMRRETVSAATPGAVPMAKTSALTAGPAGGYTPADLATAYGFNAAATAGSTQTVGIVDAYNDPNALADLNTFDAHYGLPAETSTSFKVVGQTGSTTSLPANDTTGWSTEESLDLDAVRGVCHLCKIILVEANSSTDSDLGTSVDTAVTLGATEVSNSYGGAETPGATTPAYEAYYDHAGVVITASTGDDGWFGFDQINASGTSDNAPSLPAALPSVVAVGGTSLYLNANGTRDYETVWNENGPSDQDGLGLGKKLGATGGGCSTLVSAPLWQSHVAGYSATTCGSKRMVGDISAIADPNTGYDIVDTYTTGGTWFTYGGTSLASPVIAAMWALAGGSGGLKHPDMALYGHFTSDTTKHTYDVTVGGNGFCDHVSPSECAATQSSTSVNTFGLGDLDCAWKHLSATLASGTAQCDAAPGYDGPSGVGTPIGLTTFAALAPKAVITVPSGLTHGVAATFSGTASTDPYPDGSISSYTWNFGDGGKATGASPSHTFAASGTYTVKLVVIDNFNVTKTVTKSVVVG
ncbi:PKD domain-containing protein [Jatrophihabitans sp.]|uniref:PKD domain-containing protein n=1 Tax=Jatrophihabitans sp. TaxID=1932789 RepID=UPI0030C6BB82|nr:hypothetical protein [Jatrophihabitans sp.]